MPSFYVHVNKFPLFVEKRQTITKLHVFIKIRNKSKENKRYVNLHLFSF